MTPLPAARYAVALLRCPQRNASKISEEIWTWPGCQGLEELPDADAGFYVPSEDFEILEFGSEAAEQCAEWLDSGAFQRTRPDVFVKVYLQLSDFERISGPESFLERLSAQGKRLPRGCELVSWSELPDTDYLENYKKSVKGSCVGEGLWVGPPWDTPPSERLVLFVEPGMAFGTGDHPTTQMCLALLEELSREKGFSPQRIYDVGTGSGVLAAAARKFFPGAEIIMTDLDPLCEAEVRKTFALNDLSLDACRLECGPHADLKRAHMAWEPGDLLLSNIYAGVLSSLLPELARLLKPGAPWIVSGLLEGPATEDFESKALAQHFDLKERRSQTRERPLLEAGKGLSREDETWGARLFVRR